MRHEARKQARKGIKWTSIPHRNFPPDGARRPWAAATRSRAAPGCFRTHGRRAPQSTCKVSAGALASATRTDDRRHLHLPTRPLQPAAPVASGALNPAVHPPLLASFQNRNTATVGGSMHVAARRRAPSLTASLEGPTLTPDGGERAPVVGLSPAILKTSSAPASCCDKSIARRRPREADQLPTHVADALGRSRCPLISPLLRQRRPPHRDRGDRAAIRLEFASPSATDLQVLDQRSRCPTSTTSTARRVQKYLTTTSRADSPRASTPEPV